MNSPKRAAEKKVVVRHAKTAASSGLEKSNCEDSEEMISIVRGRHFGLL